MTPYADYADESDDVPRPITPGQWIVEAIVVVIGILAVNAMALTVINRLLGDAPTNINLR